MRRSVVISVMVAAGLLTGCGGPTAEVGCTEMGSPTGIGVTVLPPLPVERVVTLRLCTTPESCTDEQVELRPGSDMIDLGCSGTGPSAPCSAAATPNGTLVGFLHVDDLPGTPITVSASFGPATTTPPAYGPTELTAELTHPNGPDCPAGGRQAAITFPGR
ncbi:hypothetical protein [Microlunatus sp. Y2014]|uniref:hypothetical protein n=1 Tax=Microlunatus sp. Y2014 TaxID=3418488 RepID=UPI003DA77884